MAVTSGSHHRHTSKAPGLSLSPRVTVKAIVSPGWEGRKPECGLKAQGAWAMWGLPVRASTVVPQVCPRAPRASWEGSPAPRWGGSLCPQGGDS